MFSAAEVDVAKDDSDAKKLEVHVLDGKVDVEAKGSGKIVVQNGQMVTVSVEDTKDDVVSAPVMIEGNKDIHEFTLLSHEIPVSNEVFDGETSLDLFSEEFQALSEKAGSNDAMKVLEMEDKFESSKAREGHVAKILNLFFDWADHDGNNADEKKLKSILPVISSIKPASGKVFNDEYFYNTPSINFSWS